MSFSVPRFTFKSLAAKKAAPRVWTRSAAKKPEPEPELEECAVADCHNPAHRYLCKQHMGFDRDQFEPGTNLTGRCHQRNAMSQFIAAARAAGLEQVAADILAAKAAIIADHRARITQEIAKVDAEITTYREKLPGLRAKAAEARRVANMYERLAELAECDARLCEEANIWRRESRLRELRYSLAIMDKYNC